MTYGSSAYGSPAYAGGSSGSLPLIVGPNGFLDELFGTPVIGTAGDVTINLAGFLDEQFGNTTVTAQSTPPYFPVPPVTPFPPTAIVGLLGCGEYEVHLGPRGGGKLLAILNVNEIQWQRTLNTLSAATIKAQQHGNGSVNDLCLDVLSTINPWAYEIEILRNNETVFVGPISGDIQYDLNTGEVSIDVRDLSAWLDVRRINQDYGQDETVAVAQAFSFIWNNAYGQDPWNMNLVIYNTAITGEYQVAAAQNKYAATELQSLTQTSIDYYVLGRKMYAFDIEAAVPTILNLTDDSWKTFPKLTVSGKAFASQILVTGEGSGAAGSSAQAEVAVPLTVFDFGLVDRTFTEPTISDPDLLQAAANSRYELVSVPYVTITGGSLNYLAPVDMNKLIPGARVLVTLQRSQRPVSGYFRLVQLDVQRTATDENIALTLVPEGTVGEEAQGTLLPQNQEAVGGGSFNGNT